MAFGVFQWSRVRAKVDPTIREAWGPLLSPEANALLVVGKPNDLILRAYPPGTHPETTLDILAPPAAAAYFRERMQVREEEEIHMQPSSAVRTGEVYGAMATVKVLDAVGASYQALRDGVVQMAPMRGRNLLLFGDPNLIPPVSKYLERGVWAIEYDPAARDFVIRERVGQGAQARVFYTGRPRPGSLRDFPGLLTVLPSDNLQGGNKSVIFSGANSTGSQAAAEFFCSPQSMRELKERFNKEGFKGFPRAYQVVVNGRAEGVSLLSFTYQAHRVLDRSEP